MVDIIWPTENNVGGSTALLEARALQESRWAGLFGGWSRFPGWVEAGLSFVSSSGLDVVLAQGEVVIQGVRVEVAQNETWTMAGASTMNRLWMQLTRDGENKVTGWQKLVTTNTTVPVDAILLAEVTATAGSALDKLYDRRCRNPIYAFGHFATDLGFGNDVVLGFRPRRLRSNFGTDSFEDGVGALDFDRLDVDGLVNEGISEPASHARFSDHGFNTSSGEKGTYLVFG